MTTRVGIIETGRPSHQLMSQYGDYPHMFMHLLSGEREMQFTAYSVIDTKMPATAKDQQAWIITGSPAGVYDNLPWIKPLMEFVSEAATQKVPTLGICFGHQLMAQAYGGQVLKSQKGRGIGVHTYEVTAQGQAYFGNNIKTAHLNAAHQDQVTQPPEGATLLLQSDFCNFAGFSYGDYGLSIQPHPEYSVGYERELVKSWQKIDPAPKTVFENAMKSLEGNPSVDATRLVPALSRFLAGAH
jgi:GMP synthase-like glutamine amidotransferase